MKSPEEIDRAFWKDVSARSQVRRRSGGAWPVTVATTAVVLIYLVSVLAIMLKFWPSP